MSRLVLLAPNHHRTLKPGSSEPGFLFAPAHRGVAQGLAISRRPVRIRATKEESMKILLANPRGFCAGVNMAIESLERALELYGTPLYVYHEIVHNRHVVERFRDRGVVFVDHLEDVPEGAHLLYSAHGVAPFIRR